MLGEQVLEDNQQVFLAFEYVVGTLRGGERQAFQMRLMNEYALQDEVLIWQEALMGLQPALLLE